MSAPKRTNEARDIDELDRDRLRAEMLRKLAYLIAEHELAAPVSIGLYIHGDVPAKRAVQLVVDDNAAAAVDAWAAYLGGTAALGEVLTTSSRSWRAYEVETSPSPWPEWGRVSVWSAIDEPAPEGGAS